MKRDKLRIIYDMLRIVRDNNPIKRTPLLRKSNLSSQSFNEYYKELINKGLIKELVNNKGRISITITSKGEDYLNKYSQIRNLIREFEL